MVGRPPRLVHIQHLEAVVKGVVEGSSAACVLVAVVVAAAVGMDVS